MAARRTGGVLATRGGTDDRTMERLHAAVDDEDEPPPWRERLLDVPDEVPKVAWLGRIALLVVVALWGMSVVFGRMTDPAGVLHLSVILFHEAGHIVFAPFGETVRVAGGTLGQLLIPFVCAVALHRRGDNFGAAIAAAWLALSLIDASVYAYDGTGADSFHDFVFLFERTGQLAHARGWAVLMKVVGGLALSASLAWAAVLLFLQSERLGER
jgi:hypothetical protein